MGKFSHDTIIGSLLWKFLERTSVQLVSFIVTILIARILCPEDYGIIALVMVFVNLANVLVEGGLNTALIQKKEPDQLDFSTIFFPTLGVATILYIILFCFSGQIASFYGNDRLVPIIKILGLSLIVFAINSIQKAFLTKQLLFKKLFVSSFGGVVVSGVIGITMALNGFGVWALVAQSISAQVAVTCIMWQTVKWRPTLEFSLTRFKRLFDFGYKIFISNLLISLFVNIRSLIIGKVYNASSLALFDRGKQFPSLIIDNINSSIQAVLFPVLSDAQENPNQIKAMVRHSIKTSSLLIFPLVFGMIATARPLVECLLTDKWIGAIPFIQIFCVAYLLMPMQIANLEAIKSLGHSGTTLKLEIIKKIIEVCILVATVTMGVKAIAWGVVLYNAICLCINIFPNKKFINYGVSEQLKDVFPTFIVSLLMGTGCYTIGLLFDNSLIKLMVEIGIGVGLYIILNIIFKIEAYGYIVEIIRSKYKN